jgi:hypothetical protein
MEGRKVEEHCLDNLPKYSRGNDSRRWFRDKYKDFTTNIKGGRANEGVW